MDRNNKKKSQGQVYYDLKMICGRNVPCSRYTIYILVIDRKKRDSHKFGKFNFMLVKYIN